MGERAAATTVEPKAMTMPMKNPPAGSKASRLGLGWALLIGLLGSVLPALHAALLPVADGLRAS